MNKSDFCYPAADMRHDEWAEDAERKFFVLRRRGRLQRNYSRKDQRIQGKFL